MSETTNIHRVPAVIPLACLKVLRPTHWLKNLLLFLPALCAHQAWSWALIGQLCVGFASMSLVASAGYIVNDLCDRTADRRHCSKRLRVIASGQISLEQVGILAAFLAMASLAISAGFLGLRITALLVVYLLATISYSLFFRRIIIADIVLLASFYLWRLVIGGGISHVDLSYWLLSVSASVALSLAMMKRLDEVSASGTSLHSGRGYGVEHRPALLTGCLYFAGLAALLLLSYVAFSAVAASYYNDRLWLWTAVVLFVGWLGYMLRRSSSGGIGGDPVLFAASDSVSLTLAACIGLAFVAAL